MRNRVYLQAAENEVIVGLVSSRGDIVKAVSSIAGLVFLFIWFFILFWTPCWWNVSVWVDIPPDFKIISEFQALATKKTGSAFGFFPSLLRLSFSFFLFDLLIKVQVQVACLSERTYRESQKLHVCICLHVSASLACALVRVEECPAVISRCPGGHFIRPWMADCSRSLMGSRNQLKESQNQHFILALVCLALAAAHAKYAQVRARSLPPPVFFSSVSTLYCYFTNNQMQCHVKD